MVHIDLEENKCKEYRTYKLLQGPLPTQKTWFNLQMRKLKVKDPRHLLRFSKQMG